MNAPYDGDRGQGADSSGSPEGPPPEHGQVPPQAPTDMYLQDAYDQDPYRAQDLYAQDPVAEALYDRAAHPPPPPGTYQPQQPLHSQPPRPRRCTPSPPSPPTLPTRTCGHRRRRPSRRARRNICRTATTLAPLSSWG